MGVWLFRNSEEIERGKSILLQLVKEKEESRYIFDYFHEHGGVAFTILYRHLQGLLCRKTVDETSTKRKEDEGINLLIHCG
nr:hypothetical protein CFP56_76105 [Quercus suber]